MRASRTIFAVIFAAVVMLAADDPRMWGDGTLISSAHAVIGRPATPGSVAGVARRTTRRTIARTAVYVSTLPPSCSVVVVNGVSLSHCGGVYYQPYGGRYVVVNVY